MKDKYDAIQKVLLLIGLALLLVSVVFLISALISSAKIEVNCDETVTHLESLLPTRTVGIKEERFNNTMPAVTYNGQDYSALLSVPRFSVKLPVRSSWDRNAVKKVPCVFTGNPYEGTLIIGGVDSDGQFDFIPKIDIGDTVVVTDMKGYEFTYTVSTVKHAKNAKAKTLIDEKHDLTLFAKDKKTGDWLLVRCNMK
ncbi:MAG: sortase [Clostridia bacterium]|nr:sortase [Clostridia bacterium]